MLEIVYNSDESFSDSSSDSVSSSDNEIDDIGQVAAYVHGREEKNDEMVPLTFQKATELYSSQVVCCLSKSDGTKYTAALV